MRMMAYHHNRAIERILLLILLVLVALMRRIDPYSAD
jgi:hypothetical protein